MGVDDQATAGSGDGGAQVGSAVPPRQRRCRGADELLCRQVHAFARGIFAGHERGRAMASMMMRHALFGIGRRGGWVAFGMNGARTFQDDPRQLARVNGRRRNERRGQQAQQEEAPMEHAGRYNGEWSCCHASNRREPRILK